MWPSISSRHVRYIAVFFFIAEGIVFPLLISAGQQAEAPRQTAAAVSPLDELTFEGLLAGDASWEYLSYLVRTRGLNFSPSSRLVKQIDSAGGHTLVSALRKANIAPSPKPAKAERQFVQRLGRCAESEDKNKFDKAKKQCLTAANLDPKNPWPLIGLAAISVEAKKYADALSPAHQAVALTPMMAEAHFMLGKALAENDQGPGAVDEFEEALHLDPDHVDSLVLLGDLYKNSAGSDNHYDETALSYYQRAEALVPDDREVHERLASLYSSKGESAAAIDEYRSLEKLDPQNAEWPRSEGKLLFDSENYAETISAYGRVLQLEPDDADAHYRRGYAMNGLKNYSDAVKDLRAANRLNPRNDRVLLSLGYASENMRHYAEAIGYLNQVLQLDPKECSAMLDIAWVLDQEKQDSQALEEYSRAADCGGDNPLDLDNLGIEFNDMGQPEKAVQVLKHLVKVEPTYVSGHINLGAAFLQLKEFGAAEAEFRKVIALAPQNILAHRDLCKTLDQEGERLAGIRECEQVVKLDPRNHEGWRSLASELENAKPLDIVLAEAQEAAVRDAQSAPAWEILAIELSRANKMPDAVAAGSKAVELDPQNGEFHYRLAGIYSQLADTDKALLEYRAAVQAAPQSALYIDDLGVALQRTGDLDGAEKLYRRSTELDPTFMMPVLNLGTVAAARGNYKVAIEYDEKARALSPQDSLPLSHLAFHLLNSGDVKDGLEYALRDVNTNPESPLAHSALGYAMTLQRSWPAAIAEYREAARLDPNNLEHQYDVIGVLVQSGDLAGVKAAYQAILQKQPNNADLWSSFGATLMNMDDDSEGFDALEKAISLEPKNALAVNNLAWFYATCDDLKFRNPSEALRLGKQVNDLTDWKNPNYIDTYAAALEVNGNLNGAVTAERQALGLAPRRTDFQATLKKYESEAAKKSSPSQ